MIPAPLHTTEQNFASSRRQPPPPSSPPELSAANWAFPDDTVELSGAPARTRPAESAQIRTDLVERIRAEIAAGTYLTDEKLESALACIRLRVTEAA
ncbi:MAG: flagellar biosynthesis anti-sigma factor FlgM [Planctomycetes bacterium]|nr:flagellar biosynthesis anti-sigma factor FlgM [Planctomycetota bacterium]